MKKIKLVIWLMILGLFIAPGAFSQKGIEDGSQYGHGQDSINCTRNLSLFYEYYKHNNYKDAIGPWRLIFNECPKCREYLYAYGVNMFKSFIEQTEDPALRIAYCDTIMMIHENRIKYFGDEGKVLGFEGTDLLRYRMEEGAEIIQKGYDLLKRSIDIEKVNSSLNVITTFMSASISLFLDKQISNEQVINDYIEVSDILEAQLKRSSSPKILQAKEAVDAGIRGSKALTCESITSIFSPKFTDKKDDLDFLKLMANFMTDADCETTDFFATVSERLYELEPSSGSAYNLARLFYKREDYNKAKSYYQEAIQRETNDEKKAGYLYELGFVYNAHLKQPVDAAACADEAIKLKSGWGDPYLLLGQAYITGKNLFSDDFQQQTVFWVAVDMFQRAKAVDPSIADKANLLINEYSNFFPSKEDVFFHTLANGQSYSVGGWINKTTTVRAR